MVTVLAACGSNFSGVKNYDGEVSSNGGFAVVKGDYVYFINGLEASTADNTFGSVVKGALVRAKLADVNAYGTATECEMVVPKLIYTDYDRSVSGFNIFGDYVYYPTPSASKDKAGNVRNTVVEFTKTKLDGTGTTVIASAEGLSTPYKFFAKDGKVYLTVYTSAKNADDEDINVFVTYGEDGKEISRSQAISSYVLPEEGGDGYAFYEKKAHNEFLDEDEDFNEVYRYSLTGEGEVKVLSGAGMYSDEVAGIGTQGVNYAFIKLTKDALYLSETYVDTSVTTITRYYGIALNDVTENTAHASLTLLNEGTAGATDIFGESSVYYALDKIIYNDATYGLVVYDYTKFDIMTFGIEQLIYSADLMSYTYCFDDGEYMYYYGNNYYYRIKIEDVLAGSENVHQITYTATSSEDDFYKFEIIGDTILILNNSDPYYEYVCAYDVNKIDALEVKEGQTKADAIKDFLDEFATADREHVLIRLNYRVAMLNDADKTALDEYLEKNYPEDSASS